MDNVYLDVIVTGVSNKLDRNGKNIVFVQKYTLPTEIIPTTTNIKELIIKNPSPFNENGIPYNIIVGNRTFAQNQTFDKIFAHETITFNGNLINNQQAAGSPKGVSFIAGEALEFLPGFSTGGTSPFEFSIGSVFEQNCAPLSNYPEVTHAFVTNFCKKLNPNVRYSGNQGATRLAVDNSNFLPPTISLTTLGYPIPNPTRGECSLSFNLAEEGGYAIQLFNILGETVRVLAKSEFAKTGPQSITFDSEGLEAGVYFITFTSNGFRQARKLVVVR